MEAAAAHESHGPDAAEVGGGPEQLITRVEELQARLDQAGDSPTRELAEALLSAVVQMYGQGLERVFGALAEAGDEGRRVATELTEDPFVATLLLIHDLHPIPLEERVQSALESVRPYMESHGGNVELISLENGVARIHLRGSCSDCSASSVTLELAIKQALEELAPDLEGLEVEGAAAQMPGLELPMANGSELPIVMSGGVPQAAPVTPSWFDIQIEEPADGSMTEVDVAGKAIVIANVDGTLLAYRDACAACGEPLNDGELSCGALKCAYCGRSYFLPRAGRSMDDEAIQLEPVPLLRERERVKVALSA